MSNYKNKMMTTSRCPGIDIVIIDDEAKRAHDGKMRSYANYWTEKETAEEKQEKDEYNAFLKDLAARQKGE